MAGDRYWQALEQKWALESWASSSRGEHWLREIFANGEKAAGDSLAGAMKLSLALSEPYYWGEEPCALLQGSAPSMPDYTLTQESLPARCGFFWFETPLSRLDIKSPKGESVPDSIRAALWVARDRHGNPCWLEVGSGTPSDIGSIFLVFFTEPIVFPHCLPTSYLSWVMGQSIEEAAWEPRVRLTDFKLGLRYMASAFSFIEQTLLTPTREALPRSTRRRAPNAKASESNVKVIRLRRKQSGVSTSDHTSVDWSCRWIVAGHWRRQWYSASSTHKPKWILPYLKGPENKPLKAANKRVFAVVR